MRSFLICILGLCLAQARAQNPYCSNADFEQGNFNGWSGAIGYNTNSFSNLTVTSNSISTLGNDAPEPSCSFHTIVSPNLGSDPYGPIPAVHPFGGGYALRLGGEHINIYNGYDADSSKFCQSNDPSSNHFSNGERIQLTMPVTPNSSIFTYNYAMVIQDGGHPHNEQAYVKVEFLDGSGNPIYYLADTFYVSNGIAPAGFIRSGVDTTVFYRNWQTKSVCVLPYMGQTVTARFTAAGCTHGDHFAYAYFDCTCSGGGPYPGSIDTYVCGGSTTMIAGPPGFSTYSWAGPGIMGASNQNTVSVNVPGTYTLTVDNNNYCPLEYSIGASPTVTVSYNPTNTMCQGDSVQMVASGVATYTWDANAGNATGSSVYVQPTSTTSYSVIGTDGYGCSDTAYATVYVMNCSTGLNSASADHFSVSPNPSTGDFILQARENYTFELIDLQGQSLFSTRLLSETTELKLSKSLGAGLYFFRLAYKNEVKETGKIVISK